MLAEILGALGIATPIGAPRGPYPYGTKSYWQWYATIYLPRYYNNQQIIQLLQRSPLYNLYGMPFPYNTGGNPYGYNPYQYQTGYPGPGFPGVSYPSYPYGYPPSYGYGQYYDPYSQPYGQAQLTQYVGEQGAQNCAAQGGIWDYFQQACGIVGNTVVSSGDTPNVVGQPKWSAVSYLNQLGYRVWLLNEDGISQGVPQDYDPRRIEITVTDGKVSGQAVG